MAAKNNKNITKRSTKTSAKPRAKRHSNCAKESLKKQFKTRKTQKSQLQKNAKKDKKTSDNSQSRRVTSVKIEQVIAHIADGLTTPEACRAVGVSVRSFYRWQHDHAEVKQRIDEINSDRSDSMTNNGLNMIESAISEVKDPVARINLGLKILDYRMKLEKLQAEREARRSATVDISSAGNFIIAPVALPEELAKEYDREKDDESDEE